MIHTCISPSRHISLTNERMHTHPPKHKHSQERETKERPGKNPK